MVAFYLVQRLYCFVGPHGRGVRYMNTNKNQEKNPNPQGKGLVPVLQDWTDMQPTVQGSRTATEFLRDYAISSLVLAAEFRFKPVLGKTYFLYSTESGWKLSLVAPQEWGQKPIGDFLARCHLRSDMIWDVELDDITEGSLSVQRAKNFVQGFIEALNGQESIADSLPSYVAELPYYRRLLAAGLSSSLRCALPGVGGEVRTLLKDSGTPLISWPQGSANTL
ncbi:MAG: hypothetical protein ACI9JM_002364 [Halioglobus sp.]|jgi:hypothetical protein